MQDFDHWLPNIANLQDMVDCNLCQHDNFNLHKLMGATRHIPTTILFFQTADCLHKLMNEALLSLVNDEIIRCDKIVNTIVTNCFSLKVVDNNEYHLYWRCL